MFLGAMVNSEVGFETEAIKSRICVVVFTWDSGVYNQEIGFGTSLYTC
jgi:hypothetical protein